MSKSLSSYLDAMHTSEEGWGYPPFLPESSFQRKTIEFGEDPLFSSLHRQTMPEENDDPFASSFTRRAIEDDGAFSDEIPSSFQRQEVQLAEAKEMPQPSLPRPDISEGLGRQKRNREIVMLANYVKKKVPFMRIKQQIYYYNGRFWEPLSDEDAVSVILETLTESGLDKDLPKRPLTDIYKRLRLDSDVWMREKVAHPQGRLCLQDGVLNLYTGQLLPHNPDYHFFRCLNVSYEEIMDPHQSGAVFEGFVDRVTGGDQTVRQQLLELTALTALGEPNKHFFVLLGPSNTGKTQFGRFLMELVGMENIATISGVHDFANRFTSGTMIGKQLVACLDLPDTPLPNIAIGFIKQLCGDDPIKAENKGANAVTITEKPLLLMAGNHPIRVPHMKNEQALLNRMVTIPMMRPIDPSEAQIDLWQNLLSEAPYILRKSIEAYRDLVDRNFEVTQAEVPSEYLSRDSNMGLQEVTNYVQTYCTYDPDSMVTTDALYSAFGAVSDSSMSAKEFSGHLKAVLSEQAGVKYDKHIGPHDKRGYKGLQLKI